jgi:hypothetical protein
MNCAVHTDTAAVAFCRTCGKALCENCKRDVMGAIYCEPCLAARLQGAPAGAARPAGTAPPPNMPSPPVALLLGFIPGVGAMYNGQFVKAIVNVGVFVMLIVATNTISEFLGFLIAFWILYMAFDAYKTAEAKRLGLPLPDPLGIDRLFGIQEHQGTATAAPQATPPPWPTSLNVPPAGEGATPASQDTAPTGAIVLIALGVLFLLSNLGFFNARYFMPLLFIGIGLWIAFKRTAQRPQP